MLLLNPTEFDEPYFQSFHSKHFKFLLLFSLQLYLFESVSSPILLLRVELCNLYFLKYRCYVFDVTSLICLSECSMCVLSLRQVLIISSSLMVELSSHVLNDSYLLDLSIPD